MITETNQYAMDICMSILWGLYFLMVFSIVSLMFFAWRKELNSEKITGDEDYFHEPENQKYIKLHNRYKNICNVFKVMVYVSLFALCANCLIIVFLWNIR